MPELIMRVSRYSDNRLCGTVRVGQGSEIHSFSGTLELMRVFEDLVPLVPDARLGESSGGGAPPAQPGAPQMPEPKIP
jgi:hypothetical protein